MIKSFLLSSLCVSAGLAWEPGWATENHPNRIRITGPGLGLVNTHCAVALGGLGKLPVTPGPRARFLNALDPTVRDACVGEPDPQWTPLFDTIHSFKALFTPGESPNRNRFSLECREAQAGGGDPVIFATFEIEYLDDELTNGQELPGGNLLKASERSGQDFPAESGYTVVVQAMTTNPPGFLKVCSILRQRREYVKNMIVKPLSKLDDKLKKGAAEIIDYSLPVIIAADGSSENFISHNTAFARFKNATPGGAVIIETTACSTYVFGLPREYFGIDSQYPDASTAVLMRHLNPCPQRTEIGTDITGITVNPSGEADDAECIDGKSGNTFAYFSDSESTTEQVRKEKCSSIKNEVKNWFPVPLREPVVEVPPVDGMKAHVESLSTRVSRTVIINGGVASPVIDYVEDVGLGTLALELESQDDNSTGRPWCRLTLFGLDTEGTQWKAFSTARESVLARLKQSDVNPCAPQATDPIEVKTLSRIHVSVLKRDSDKKEIEVNCIDKSGLSAARLRLVGAAVEIDLPEKDHQFFVIPPNGNLGDYANGVGVGDLLIRRCARMLTYREKVGKSLLINSQSDDTSTLRTNQDFASAKIYDVMDDPRYIYLDESVAQFTPYLTLLSRVPRCKLEILRIDNSPETNSDRIEIIRAERITACGRIGGSGSSDGAGSTDQDNGKNFPWLRVIVNGDDSVVKLYSKNGMPALFLSIATAALSPDGSPRAKEWRRNDVELHIDENTRNQVHLGTLGNLYNHLVSIAGHLVKEPDNVVEAAADNPPPPIFGVQEISIHKTEGRVEQMFTAPEPVLNDAGSDTSGSALIQISNRHCKAVINDLPELNNPTFRGRSLETRFHGAGVHACIQMNGDASNTSGSIQDSDVKKVTIDNDTGNNYVLNCMDASDKVLVSYSVTHEADEKIFPATGTVAAAAKEWMVQDVETEHGTETTKSVNACITLLQMRRLVAQVIEQVNSEDPPAGVGAEPIDPYFFEDVRYGAQPAPAGKLIRLPPKRHPGHVITALRGLYRKMSVFGIPVGHAVPDNNKASAISGAIPLHNLFVGEEAQDSCDPKEFSNLIIEELDELKFKAQLISGGEFIAVEVFFTSADGGFLENPDKENSPLLLTTESRTIDGCEYAVSAILQHGSLKLASIDNLFKNLVLMYVQIREYFAQNTVPRNEGAIHFTRLDWMHPTGDQEEVHVMFPHSPVTKVKPGGAIHMHNDVCHSYIFNAGEFKQAGIEIASAVIDRSWNACIEDDSNTLQNSYSREFDYARIDLITDGGIERLQISCIDSGKIEASTIVPRDYSGIPSMLGAKKNAIVPANVELKNGPLEKVLLRTCASLLERQKIVKSIRDYIVGNTEDPVADTDLVMSGQQSNGDEKIQYSDPTNGVKFGSVQWVDAVAVCCGRL